MENDFTTAQLPTEGSPSAEEQRPNRGVIIGVIVGGIALVALVTAIVIFLLQPNTDTARYRDIFIIFMALESLIIGLTLIILIVQIARLINLLQNEIRPIIDSTNETVSTLRGTTQFLSDNLIEPVIKLNEYLAGFSQIVSIVRSKNKKK